MDNLEGRPKLAVDSEIEQVFLAKPKLAASAKLIAAITPIKGEGFSKKIIKLLKALIGLTLVVLFTLSFTWVILISTIVATPTIGSNVLFVDRNAWGLGRGEAGKIAYATENYNYGLIDKLQYHLSGDISNGYIVQLVAKPLDQVATTAERYLIVNGEATGYLSDSIIDLKQLGDKYIAVCLEGSCGIPGTLVEVPIEHAIGEVSGIITASGIKPYEK